MFEAEIWVTNTRDTDLERIIQVKADLISQLVEMTDEIVCRNAFELSLGKSLTVYYRKNK